MASSVNRRRFLKSAATGLAAGAAVQVAGSALAAENPSIPVPDTQTKPTSDGTGQQPSCACGSGAAQIIFPCSGSADVGKIADLSARKLMEEGIGKMSCLAGIGGRVKVIMETTQAAQAILVIDGCPLQCAKNTLENAGFKQFTHVRLYELGMEKTKSPATDERVAQVVSHCKSLLAHAEKQKG